MRRHELKILPKWYEDVESSKKNFEIRRNDRDFKVGDTLVLREYKEGSYTGRQITRKIQYIYQGNGDYGLSEGYCILGLEQEPICIAKVEFDEDKLQEIVKEQVARIEITTEREPCGDLISREATLTAFADYVGSGMSMDDYDALWNIVTKMPSVKPQEPSGDLISRQAAIDVIYNNEYKKDMRKELEHLPSVKQEPKIGHWIPRNSFLLRYKCSECERESEKYNYCPNCGAKMVEPQKVREYEQ